MRLLARIFDLHVAIPLAWRLAHHLRIGAFFPHRANIQKASGVNLMPTEPPLNL